jgi:hypothetical protein
VSSLLYTAGSLMPKVASITFKAVHFFHDVLPDVVFVGACTNRTIVAAYRRTAACAVAWHNRNVRLRKRQGPLVWLFDAFDMVKSFPRASKASDGHHLVNDYLHAVTDRYLYAVVCPAKWSETSDDPSLRSAETFISRSEEDISHRFSCREVFEALGLEGNVTAKPPKARKRRGNTAPSAPEVRMDKLGFSVRQDKPGALERLVNLGPRPACRCENPDDRLNDDCALGRQLSTVLTKEDRYTGGVPLAAAFYRHMCDLSNARWKKTPTLPDPTRFAQDMWAAPGNDWRDEVVAELCLRPHRRPALHCLRNVGFAPAFPSWEHHYLKHFFSTSADGTAVTTDVPRSANSSSSSERRSVTTLLSGSSRCARRPTLETKPPPPLYEIDATASEIETHIIEVSKTKAESNLTTAPPPTPTSMDVLPLTPPSASAPIQHDPLPSDTNFITLTTGIAPRSDPTHGSRGTPPRTAAPTPAHPSPATYSDDGLDPAVRRLHEEWRFVAKFLLPTLPDAFPLQCNPENDLNDAYQLTVELTCRPAWRSLATNRTAQGEMLQRDIAAALEKPKGHYASLLRKFQERCRRLAKALLGRAAAR